MMLSESIVWTFDAFFQTLLTNTYEESILLGTDGHLQTIDIASTL